MLKKILIGWGIINFIALAVLFSGCCTHGSITEPSVIDDTRRIAALEARINDYERRIEEYDRLIGGTVSKLGTIRERADKITDRVDRIIYLFEEYDKEVQRLDNDYAALRRNYQATE